jgi:dTDP-4-amino-4,6-dideoxygalactose transaminase
MIPYTKPTYTGNEDEFVLDAIHSNLSSNKYNELCEKWFQKHLNCEKALLTTSCTHAIEMCALLLNIEPGDEVIMPSFTFTSTANAFALRGAKIIFVDVKPETLNINEDLIESAITKKTKAIVAVHYAGVSCNMEKILLIANKHQIIVIEDAAQGMLATYKNKPLGTLGHLGTYSFHQTKNFTSGGEGGLLIINDPQFLSSALIIREKGTNRDAFISGQVDKYTWVNLGSSYVLSEIQAAYLWGQLQEPSRANQIRINNWEQYRNNLTKLVRDRQIELPEIPPECVHNAHIFYIKVKDKITRDTLSTFLKKHQITAPFHYSPLHTSTAGQKYGKFAGEDLFTTRESERLIRLPLYNGITNEEIIHVCLTIERFFQEGQYK